MFNSKSGVGNYPGKIFEYFAAQKPILSFGPEGSDTQSLISNSQTGSYFSYEEQNIENEILNLFNRRSKLVSSDISRFSRENLTVELSDLLNKL